MSKLLKAWMKEATVPEQERLAQLADTSRNYLYQLANGERDASAGLAGRIERAAELLRREGHKLPLLPRHGVSKDCTLCNYTAPRKR